MIVVLMVLICGNGEDNGVDVGGVGGVGDDGGDDVDQGDDGGDQIRDD